jgi:acetoacetyl-CoA synthetase
MTAFTRHVADTYGIELADYAALHRWSIAAPADFWGTLWDWCSVVASRRGNTILADSDQFPGARWFPDARLNFAENLLRYRDDQTALVGLIEGGERRSLTYAELWSMVESVAAAMTAEGVQPGDRVAGFMPNIPETVVAMLATASLGAVWTSCSPDFGRNGATDRFGQVSPKLLFTADAYRYNGKVIDCIERAGEIADAVTSIERVVIVPLIQQQPPCPEDKRFVILNTWMMQAPARPLAFVQLPFDHPLYIMYSSGTTGVPKCIVHGAGGTLLQHLKEHQLHTDLGRDDVLFYFTTCGWMMWNWLVSGLASGCTLVLYDGSPFASKGRVLVDAIDAEGITVFGVGAKYIDSLEKANIRPTKSHQLTTLKTILSTGSPLSRNSYEYIYRDFKADVCLASISGGTDIISCFVLGNPNLPVYPGEIQCVGLGMAVEFWDDHGQPLIGEKGELVCTQPFPSAPLGFWNDAADERYHDAYFSRFDGVWAHGDWGELTPRGGVIIHGRSDAVLNPGGVRIGTAEIYRQVETVGEVLDSVVIGQQWEGDERVVLFVVLRGGQQLSDALIQRIKQVIRDNATPRHVPAKIIAVPDIPRTISGKVVELAVKNVVHGRPVKNTDALANAEALAYFRDIPELA